MFITGAVIVMLTAIAVHVKLKSVFSELIRSYQARRVEWPGQNKKGQISSFPWSVVAFSSARCCACYARAMRAAFPPSLCFVCWRRT